MNICILLYPTVGGSGIVATNIGNEMAIRGHKIHFVSYDFPIKINKLNDNIFYHNVNTSDYPLFKYTPYESALVSKLVDIITFNKIDILHLHYAIPHAPAAYFAMEILKETNQNIPFITTLHGTDITLLGIEPYFKSIINFSLNKSNAITCVSETLKKETFNNFNINKEIEVIYNFVSIDQDVDYKSLILDEEIIFCHISNFRKVKNIDKTILIFEKLSKNYKSKLYLVGDGPERQKSEILCRELNLCDRVVFTGMINNPSEVLKKAHIYFLLSDNESFGLTALEALSLGVPVISTNNGGIVELNLDGKTGYCVDPKDIDMAIEKTKDIIENYKKFQINAFEQSKSFEKEKIINQYEVLYKKLVNEHKC